MITSGAFGDPRMWVWVGDSTHPGKRASPYRQDRFGIYFDVRETAAVFNTNLKSGSGKKAIWEEEHLDQLSCPKTGRKFEPWPDGGNVYHVPPVEPKGDVNDYYREIALWFTGKFLSACYRCFRGRGRFDAGGKFARMVP